MAKKGGPGPWKGRDDCPLKGYWKGKRGALRHDSKPVMTPHGQFESLRLAADSLDVWLKDAWLLTIRGSQGFDTGWYYL